MFFSTSRSLEFKLLAVFGPRIFETSLVCQRFFEGVEAEAPAESADVDGDAAEKAEDMAEVPAADAECLCTFCTSLGAALMCAMFKV